MEGLSYEDYFKKLEEMVESLREHWSNDQRVNALKIAIQLAKLLAETNQLKLYSKKYKLITDLLDEFGQLVYIRIHSMANLTDSHNQQHQPSNSRGADKPDEEELEERLARARELAKDTCRNWFLKVASIRELVPRFYTELSILKTCDILVKRAKRVSKISKSKLSTTKMETTTTTTIIVDENPLEEQLFSQTLKRLSGVAWGLGDPIVALYGRAYLCKVASTRLIGWKEMAEEEEEEEESVVVGGQVEEDADKNLSQAELASPKGDLRGLWRPKDDSSSILKGSSPNGLLFRNELLFELLRMNLEACVTLVYHLDINSIRRLVLDQNVELSSYLDLLSMPIQSILNIVTSRYDSYKQEQEQEDDDGCEKDNHKAKALNLNSVTLIDHVDDGTRLGGSGGVIYHNRRRRRSNYRQCCIRDTKSKLESMLDCLLNGVWQDKCCILGRNLLLYSAFRGCPPDVVASRGKPLLDALQMTYDTWIGSADIINYDDNSLTSIEPTIYITLNSFLVSLDGSDLFETMQTHDMVQLKHSIVCFAEKVMDNISDRREQQQHKTPTIFSSNYLKCFKSLILFAYHHTDLRKGQLDKLLMKFLTKIEGDRQYVNHYGTLMDIIKILVSNETDFSQIKLVFGWRSFKKLYDLLRRDEHRLEASKWILETMRANMKLLKCRTGKSSTQDVMKNQDVICDRDTINILLRLVGDINDSLSVLMALDDFEHLSNLVIYFLEKISINDYQEQLNFLSRCRSLVGNLNLALEYLVRRILRLANEYRKVEKKRQMRQNYLNGCLAYAFITIPAIDGASTRLDLYLQGSRMALDYMSLSLADYYLKQVMLNLIDQTKQFLDEQRRRQDSTTRDNSNYSENGRPDNTTSSGQQWRSMSKQLIQHALDVTELVVQHQDHIDLKHKLALTELIKGSFDECSSLLQMLKLVSSIDDDNDDQLEQDFSEVHIGGPPPVEAP